MIYADTDFFLAIAKKEDWLKSSARQTYQKHKGAIVTSLVTLIELLLVAQKRGYQDLEELVASVFQIADLEGIKIDEATEAAFLIREKKLGVFDAFHAVLSRGRPIASSEHIYDLIGKERIPLEK